MARAAPAGRPVALRPRVQLPICQPGGFPVHAGDVGSHGRVRFRTTAAMTVYRINHLERLPLRTPYPAQIERVRYIIARLPRETDLVVDFTGVGRGIFDMAVDA